MFTVRKLSASVIAAGLLVAAGGAEAGAHVTVNAPGATQGGYTVLTIRVPTESDTASTIGLKFALPTDQPLAIVSVQPHPGWNWAVKKTKLATPIKNDDGDEVSEVIGEIDWTATAGGIKPGEFDQFAIQIGALPKVPSMTFRAIQHYSDNTDVRWVEQAAPGSTAEPDHPAPHLDLAPAAGAATSAAGSTGPVPVTSQASGPSVTLTAGAVAKSSSNNHAALITAIIALVVAAGAGVLAVVSGRRRQTS